MFSRKDTSEYLTARDYQVYLTNRGLLDSSNSRLRFTQEGFDTDRTLHAVRSGSSGAIPDDEPQVAPLDFTPPASTAEETTPEQPPPTHVKFHLSSTFDTVGSNQLTAARETVSLHLPTEQLRKACGSNIRHFEISYHATLGAVYGLLSRAVARGVEVSPADGKLGISSQYKNDSAPLTAEDEQILEAVDTAWELFVKACCALALAEAAWRIDAGEEAGGDAVEKGLTFAGASVPLPAVSNAYVDTGTGPNDEAEVGENFLEKVEELILCLEELNARGTAYLSGPE